MYSPLTLFVTLLLTATCLMISPAACLAEPDSAAPLNWLREFPQAHRAAKESGQDLLVFFYGSETDQYRRQFEDVTLADPKVREQLQSYVLCKQPLEAEALGSAPVAEEPEHAGFHWLRGRQGLAILDLQHNEQPYYDAVVSYLPFAPPAYYASSYHDVASLRVLLDLPPGTITQRTMIYAVRMHPQRPASTTGPRHAVLMQQCAEHCSHQARIQRQGHHNWNSRFHSIAAELGGRAATEVCAESWPGVELLTASLDCVHSWQQSSGHWNAVRRAHGLYGYDIQRGGNKIWYATGIFADRAE